MFELYYNKNKNDVIFEYLEGKDTYTNMQNYIPLYDKFFNLNNTNWNHVNLNNNLFIEQILEKHDDTNYTILTNSKHNNKVQSFVKLAPLYDPIKFMAGKYDAIESSRLLELPKYECDTIDGKNDVSLKNVDSKKQSVYNSAYTDGFFSYLTSKAFHEHSFVHGLNFYGSFIGVKKDLTINIADEIDYLQESDHFFKSNNIDFTIDKSVQDEIMNIGTRKYKSNLKVNSLVSHISMDNLDDLNMDEIFSNQTAVSTLQQEYSQEVIYNNSDNRSHNNSRSTKHTNSSSSSCSSRFSNTSSSSQGSVEDDSISIDDEELQNAIENVSLSDDEEYDNLSIDSNESIIVNATLHKCPVHLIFLEKMTATLDSYIMENELTITEWKSILFQVIAQLYAYQRMFDFTHNDLHTNNIMYIETEKKHLLYNIDGTYYKVPTFGKIYKIIDFGRAIYRFKGHRICSDSYDKKGDAHTQYNCEPFFNSNKKRIEPNYAFDLCRLGCSLYDYFEEELVIQKLPQSKKKHVIASLIEEWCTDDNGMNILYKKNGRDRYPGFKLYKMIARTVTKHTPKHQLEKGTFDIFKTTRKKLNKRSKIISIDKLPQYY